MKQITLKHTIGDIVFFMDNNAISYGDIVHISTNLSASKEVVVTYTIRCAPHNFKRKESLCFLSADLLLKDLKSKLLLKIDESNKR